MRSKNATCDEGENEDKWKRCEHEQVQQFVDKVCKLEVSGCHVKHDELLKRIGIVSQEPPQLRGNYWFTPPPPRPFRISNDLLWEW